MLTFRILALVALACFLMASEADAASIIRLDYVGGSSAPFASSGTTVRANVSDLLSFDISVDVDSAGLNVVAFGLSWSAASTPLVSTNWAEGQFFTSFAPATSGFNLKPTVPSVTGGTGLTSNIGLIPGLSSPAAFSTNVFLGSVVFHWVGSGTRVRLLTTGFFDSNSAIAQDGSLSLITRSSARSASE